MDPQNKEHTLKKVMVLGAIAVVLVVFVGVSNQNNMQQASSLTSKVAQDARNLSQVPIEKMTDNKKQPPVTLRSDESLNTDVAEINTQKNVNIKNSPNSTFWQNNKFSNWGVVSYTRPQAAQTAVIDGQQLHTTNRIMVAAGNFPLFILNPTTILYGTKNNPALNNIQNWYAGGAMDSWVVSYSSNVSLTPVTFTKESGGTYTQDVIMIPANQTASFKVDAYYNLAKLYPDTYSSNINSIDVWRVWFDDYTQTYVSQNFAPWTLNVQPNQTNKITVVGETGPYISNYPVNPIIVNDTITLEGYRFGTNPTIKITYYDQMSNQQITVPDFTLQSVNSTLGRKKVEFSITGQGIPFNGVDGINIQVADQNGMLSNMVHLLVSTI